MPDQGQVNRDLLRGVPETPARLRRRIHELEHRLKNVLCNVLALVDRAERDAAHDSDALKTLSRRINALSRSQTTSAQGNGQPVELSSILAAALTDVFGHDRIVRHGPPLALNARAALALESVLHELATNAAKYGGFSQDGGRVELSWHCFQTGGQRFTKFRWKELGGPKISSQPRAGFGSHLITALITGDLKGEIRRDWRSKGVIVEFRLPFDEIRMRDNIDAAAAL